MSAWRRRRGIPRRSIGRGRRSASARRHAGRDRAALEYRGERGAVRAVQTRRLSGRLAINQPFRPMGVELDHPIANDLERHPADLRRLGPARAVVNRRQRQKPPGLRPILRPPRGSPHHPRIKISPKWEWDWRTSCARHLESDTRRSGNPPSESRLLSFGINGSVNGSSNVSLGSAPARLTAPLGPLVPRPRTSVAYGVAGG